MTQNNGQRQKKVSKSLKPSRIKTRCCCSSSPTVFKVERQAFIDAMVMTGVSRQDAEKRFLDYVKNKGRG
jgi:hypothetical protein